MGEEITLTNEQYECLKSILACAGIFAEYGATAEHTLDNHERWLISEAHKHANSQLSLLMQLTDKFVDYGEWLEPLLHQES